MKMNIKQLLALPTESMSIDLNQLCLSYDFKAFPELEDLLNEGYFSFEPQELIEAGVLKGKVRVRIQIKKDHNFRGNDSSYTWGLRVVEFLGKPVMIIQNGSKSDSSVKVTIINRKSYVNLSTYLMAIILRKKCESVIEIDPEVDVPEFESFCGHGISDTGWEYKDA
jgi:hypothetical protein